MPSPRASIAALALLVSCRRPGAPALAPRYLLCLGVSLAAGREPPMLDGGRLDLWVVGGDPIGHVDRSAEGRYHAAVRTALEPGTRVAGSLAGSNAVEAHRFHSPAHVPLAVQRITPDAGFALRAGEGLPVTWRGGDSTHVALVVTVSRGPGDAAQSGWLLTCVVPRGRGRFVIPARAFPAGRVPADADTVTVTVAADDRVVEEEFALDVTPVGSADDQAVGTFVR
jgi:hypothetical protein